MPTIHTHSTTFILQAGETLLEGLERTGHEVEYQCRSGYCGSCRVRLLSGSVSYREWPLAFLAEGEILPCCCRVEEDLVLAVRQPPEQADLFVPDLFAQDKSTLQVATDPNASPPTHQNQKELP